MEYCVFSKTKWNVIFFSQERWECHCPHFPFKLHTSKMNGAWELPGRRGEAGREKEDPSSLCPLPANLAPHCCLPYPLVLEPTVPGTTQQSADDWGYVPFLTPVCSMYHTEINPQDHLIHPAVSKKQSIRRDNLAPRSSFVTLVRGLIFLRNAFLWSN